MATPVQLDVVPGSVRARGGVRLVVGRTPGGSAPLRVAESGGFRVRFPRTTNVCEGVLINTGGGLTGGDRMSVEAVIGAGASAVLTTQAAEKIYRSDGPDAETAVDLTLEAGSCLAWLPQEQILFDGARLRRRVDLRTTADACLTLAESVVFGRVAMGETMARGSYRDRWRVRRDGRLVFAEEVCLAGAIESTLARKAVANGARAAATLLHLSPDAEARREEARALLEGARSECGLSAWNGMLVARFLSPDPQALRGDLARFLEGFRGHPMPRSWQC
jgi:urease accessory protein